LHSSETVPCNIQKIPSDANGTAETHHAQDPVLGLASTQMQERK